MNLYTKKMELNNTSAEVVHEIIKVDIADPLKYCFPLIHKYEQLFYVWDRMPRFKYFICTDCGNAKSELIK